MASAHPLANRPDDRNDPNMEWDFTEDNYAHIEVRRARRLTRCLRSELLIGCLAHCSSQRLIKKYPINYKQSCVIPLLDLAQRQQGVDGRGGW